MIDEKEREIRDKNRIDHGGNVPFNNRVGDGSEYAGVAVDDAFSTIIQWLYTRIPMVEMARREVAEKKGGAGAG